MNKTLELKDDSYYSELLKRLDSKLHKNIPRILVMDALTSGNYKAKNIWTELYIRFRQENIYLYVDKRIDDQTITNTVELLKNVDFMIYSFNLKKAVGAYLLSLICVKPTDNFFVKNPHPDIRYRKV